MPHFSTRPPDDNHRHALPIRRTPTTGALQAIVTSDDLLGCDTHYFNGRTTPCERPDCEPCGKGIGFRWHAYLGAIDLKTKIHIIFETTAQASETFVDYRRTHGTLRGCMFLAERLHRRPNGRVIIRCKPADLQQIHLPKPPDLVACLSVIWALPLTSDSPYPRLAGTRTQPPEYRSRPIPDDCPSAIHGGNHETG